MARWQAPAGAAVLPDPAPPASGVVSQLDRLVEAHASEEKEIRGKHEQQAASDDDEQTRDVVPGGQDDGRRPRRRLTDLQEGNEQIARGEAEKHSCSDAGQHQNRLLGEDQRDDLPATQSDRAKNADLDQPATKREVGVDQEAENAQPRADQEADGQQAERPLATRVGLPFREERLARYGIADRQTGAIERGERLMIVDLRRQTEPDLRG